MAGTNTEVITATQWQPAASVPLTPHPPRAVRPPTPRAVRRTVQPHLPGMGPAGG